MSEYEKDPIEEQADDCGCRDGHGCHDEQTEATPTQRKRGGSWKLFLIAAIFAIGLATTAVMAGDGVSTCSKNAEAGVNAGAACPITMAAAAKKADGAGSACDSTAKSACPTSGACPGQAARASDCCGTCKTDQAAKLGSAAKDCANCPDKDKCACPKKGSATKACCAVKAADCTKCPDKDACACPKKDTAARACCAEKANDCSKCPEGKACVSPEKDAEQAA